jgi:hypothetical protein
MTRLHNTLGDANARVEQGATGEVLMMIAPRC